MSMISDNSLVLYSPSRTDVQTVAPPSLPDRLPTFTPSRELSRARELSGNISNPSGYISAEMREPNIYTPNRKLSVIDRRKTGSFIDTYA